jgi:hypothetical protein
MAAYQLLLDLDDNNTTGMVVTNGQEVLGIDMVAQYANFENPVTETNPLEGTLHFWLDGSFCPLLYIDYLANVWRSAPGYVWVTIPRAFMEPYLASNSSGLIKVLGKTFHWPLDYVDQVPNSGSLHVPLTALTDIKANGSDEPAAIHAGEELRVSVQLTPSIKTGMNSDWWCVAETPLGWYHFNSTTSLWRNGFHVSRQGPLVPVSPPFEVLKKADLPVGNYHFYFGIDDTANGSFDGTAYYNSIEATILP